MDRKTTNITQMSSSFSLITNVLKLFPFMVIVWLYSVVVSLGKGIEGCILLLIRFQNFQQIHLVSLSTVFVYDGGKRCLTFSLRGCLPDVYGLVYHNQTYYIHHVYTINKMSAEIRLGLIKMSLSNKFKHPGAKIF